MWGFLLKFQSRERLESLQSGCLYMNPINYFKKIDYSKPHLYDNFENTNIYMQHAKINVLQDKKQIYSGIVQDIAITHGQYQNQLSHIWCCFHITKGSPMRLDNKLFSEDMWEFGDHLLFIGNFNEFRNRVLAAIQKHRLNCKANTVRYISKAPFINDMNIFTKFDNYAYQHEYRIGIQAPDYYMDHPYRLDIGSIHNISSIIHRSKVKNLVHHTADNRGYLSLIEI